MKQLNRRRRKPRDLCESLIVDNLELMEERTKGVNGRPMNSEEAQWLVNTYKALTEARVSDAEADAIGALTIKELTAMDAMAIEVREINVDATGNDAPALPGVSRERGQPPGSDPATALDQGLAPAPDETARTA
jgi:hypothetical protein